MTVNAVYRPTDAGLLPDDWECVTLAKVVDFANGKPHEGDVDPLGHYYLVTLDSIGIDGSLKTHHRLVRRLDNSLAKDDIVVILSDIAHGDLLGLCDLIPADNSYVLNQRVGRLRTKPDYDANPRYLRFQINRQQNHFKKRGQGTSQRHIYRRDIDSLQVPMPTLPEQRAIAEALSDVDALIESLDQLIAKKRDIKQAAMQQLLTGQRRLPGFGGEWEVKRFGEVATPRRDRVDPRQKGVHDFCVELEHIEQGTGKLLGSISTGINSSLKTVFREGDVLFGKLRAYLRKYWLANRPGICSTEIWALEPNVSRITSGYLFQTVQQDRFVETASTAYGTHMPRSDWSVVKTLELRLPLVDEQIAIAEVLSDMDSELAALEQRRDKTRALKQGMMQELLTGRTRLI